MITVKVNGKNKEVKENTSIADFLKSNNIDPIGVTVEHNLEVINPGSIAEIMLKDGDTLEVLRFVGGG
ncbi:sulfur carrier protein ThiS [Candidatus Endomicrobiellum trichonymphae]|uniref:Thiazole biosynthesis protein ThiS n=1 Tax=Endomicrobium trichonymphae TaxID=1408204 RepID=B1H023_ENDTX|nr:sulfur carrier protein ThiS [Candidatus Endomicrobium trichonymphae]BAG13855.1 thiazole biosynthesis protein ThiS [Candidatus Endomicrobium trichonymphae]